MQTVLMPSIGFQAFFGCRNYHRRVRIATENRWGKLDTRHDRQGDGCLLGREGELYPPDTPLDRVEPVTTSDGSAPRGSVVFVNGIMTDQALQHQVHQALAGRGFSVVGVRNATEGLARDLWQCARDKMNLDHNPATETVLRLLSESLDKSQPLHLIGHSQGSLIVSNAIKRLSKDLQSQGLSQPQIMEKLGLIQITTIGGATFHYPPGPRYHHLMNWVDPVTWMAGNAAISWLTCQEGEVSRFTAFETPQGLPPLSEGLSTYFCRFVDSTVHGPKDVYAPHL